MEKYDQLKKILGDGTNETTFITYCKKSELAKDKQGRSKYPFFALLSAEKLAELYNKVKAEGLIFDGNHITLQSTGISYDYIAYKNKMLLAYPNTLMDLQLVYKGDTFSFKKENGKIIYKHDIANPFGCKDADIIGGYCVIINERGEFLTTLTLDDINKHKKVAKTSYIWNEWFKEMCLKTIIKKAVKYHFNDVFVDMEVEEYKHVDLEDNIQEDRNIQELIESSKNKAELTEIWRSLSETEQLEYNNAIVEHQKTLK